MLKTDIANDDILFGVIVTCINVSLILSFLANYFNGSLSYLIRHSITQNNRVLRVGPRDFYFLVQ